MMAAMFVINVTALNPLIMTIVQKACSVFHACRVLWSTICVAMTTSSNSMLTIMQLKIAMATARN